MEYNKDEACRAMEIAEKKFVAQELAAAKKFAVKAQQLYPSLEGLPQMMAVLDVYMSAEKKVNGVTDWYAILQVDLLADEALIKKQYRKLALMLHPDKNKCAGAEGAFKLIGEAWGVLSDKIKRSLYDYKRNFVAPPAHRIIQRSANPPPPPPANNGGFFKYTQQQQQQQGRGGASVGGVPGHASATFWTACPFCKMQYEYPRNFVNHNLLCPTCQKPFVAFETAVLHRNGHSVPGPNITGAGAAGMSRGRGVPYPSSSSTFFSQNTIPRASNTPSPSPSAPASGDKPKNDPSPPGKNIKKNDSKKENDGRRGVTEKNKRRRKARVESDSDEVIHAASVSEDDDDDEEQVVEEVDQEDKGNAKDKSRKIDRGDTPRSRSRKKHSEQEQEQEQEQQEEEDEDDDDGPETIDVPDSDFYDFDNDRSSHCFQSDQIWAVYDDDDGMPRFYARIHKVFSTSKFKVKMNWLEALKKEKAVTDWLDAGFYQGCGDFKPGKAVSSDALNIFSHVVVWEKCSKGVIRIIPQKGDVWALYREWSSKWDETTPRQDRHRYEMVEISSDFVEEVGVCVTTLVKVEGFKSVFQKTHTVKSIPRTERTRFSHQVPAKKLLGEEAPNLPKNCWELDPAATSEDGDMATA